ncbi:hypothetical protein B0T18DRAFT_47043 [Schizothecium vesticola]|uniref:Uncharacterized protein n=1 Tax=Schizothecium vesticola TaxID=314040 RepID=A0AA40FBQ1_9PEZI|nr:hypothetical protein B0T18DRAFT_47043 [Schizothecium vesticola]
MSGGGGGGDAGTVGALLAGIATSLTESLRILLFADKRAWGPDEFEQLRALEVALDDARKDFQEMAPLVHGQFYYQNDRTPESLIELYALSKKFTAHAQNFRDWARQGGPINPIWARETGDLKRELHRAQCRAARRIFSAEQEQPRCLGAFQVYRQQKRAEVERQRRQRAREALPPWQQQQQQQQQPPPASQSPPLPPPAAAPDDTSPSSPHRRTSLEALVPACNAVGRFERLGAHDAAFVCDFCDGFLVWPDLAQIPAERTAQPPSSSTYPHWQATGMTSGADAQDEERPGQTRTGAAPKREKQIVFPPLAIANHLAPEPGDWRARILCPYCEDETYMDPGGEDSEEEARYNQDERGFVDVEAFRAHLEWTHTAMAVVPPIGVPKVLAEAAGGSCRVM